MLSRESFYGSHRWHMGKTPGRMLKKARLLTRPTLARRDAPYPMQCRSSAADPSFHVSRLTFHGPCERSENAAGGLFQHPARFGGI